MNTEYETITGTKSEERIDNAVLEDGKSVLRVYNENMAVFDKIVEFGLVNSVRGRNAVLVLSELHKAFQDLNENKECNTGLRSELATVLSDPNDIDSKPVGYKCSVKVVNGKFRSTFAIEYDSEDKTVRTSTLKVGSVGVGMDSGLNEKSGKTYKFAKAKFAETAAAIRKEYDKWIESLDFEKSNLSLIDEI